MEPSLRDGDRLVVYTKRKPMPGDVVVFVDPRARERTLVKRVASVTEAGVVAFGDNSASSTDSRQFGVVSWTLVRGVCRYRYFPAAKAGRI